jgi:hypothetical protein
MTIMRPPQHGQLGLPESAATLVGSLWEFEAAIANPTKSWSKQLFARTAGYPNSQMIAFLRSKSW